LIDVRDAKEIAEAGQIPTSISIPCEFSVSIRNCVSLPFSIDFVLVEKVYDELRLSAPAFGAKYERPKPGLYDELIFYCKFGDRSQEAAEMAAKAGYRK
jgi:rhodanese-related sulfurtransferase